MHTVLSILTQSANSKTRKTVNKTVAARDRPRGEQDQGRKAFI